MENKILTFSLSTKQLKYREILGKEFLEMEVWAISDIDPNLNKTHFVTEGLQAFVARRGAINKPVLGYFEKNDFVSHDGFRDYDPELQKGFWNTERGERILGWVRESDSIELAQKDNLNWVKFTCVLCTKYCYKQVKRLLRDRSKKVSVEITVLDYEMKDGIEQIKDFELNGVTILGSKNGKPVQEAIPGAQAIVLEDLNDEAFAYQKEQIEQAYSVFDGEGDKNAEEKEESNVDPITTPVEGEVTVAVEGEATFAETNTVTETNACGGEQTASAGEAQEGGEQNNAEGEGCGDGENNCNNDCGEEGAGEGDGDGDDVGEDPTLDECRAALEASECKLSELQQQFEALQADYAASQARVSELEQIVETRRRADLNAYAIQKIGADKIADEDRESIMKKCEDGSYATQEDVDKDIAYAVYKARPTQDADFTAPIVAVGIGEQKRIPMTRAERIAARNGKNI